MLRHLHRGFRRCAISLVLAWVVVSQSPGAPSSVELSPVEFKSAFLSKIPSYIKWPEGAFASAEEPILIGILGATADPVHTLLEELLKGRTLNNRTFVVQSVSTPEEIRKCKVLFVPAGQLENWQQLNLAEQARGLLTIGEHKDFLTKSGGVLNLSVEERIVEVQIKHARRAGLEIDSKLLRISKVLK